MSSLPLLAGHVMSTTVAVRAMGSCMDKIRSDMHQPPDQANIMTQKHCRSIDTAYQSAFGCCGIPTYTPAVDKTTGFSGKCAHLINSITTNSHNLSEASVAKALIVPCKCIFILPSPIGVQPMFCQCISNAIQWVILTQPVQTDVSCMLVSAAGTMIQRVCSLPAPDLEDTLRELQPCFFVERFCFLFCLMTYQPSSGSLPHEAFVGILKTLRHLGDAHRRIAQPQSLQGPGFRHATMRLLAITMKAGSGNAQFADEVLGMLHFSQSYTQPPPTGSLTQLMGHVMVSDEDYLRDLVRSSRVRRRAGLSVTLAYFLFRDWKLMAVRGGDAEWQATLLLLSRIMCMYALSVQELQQKHQVKHDRRLQHLHQHVLEEQTSERHPQAPIMAYITFTLLNIDTSCLATAAAAKLAQDAADAVAGAGAPSVLSMRLPYMMLVVLQHQPGMVLSVEAMIRVTLMCTDKESSGHAVMDLVVMMVPMFVGRTQLTNRSAFVSLAATVRKVMDSRSSTAKSLMRHWCSELVMYLQSLISVDSDRLVVIFASMLTMSYCGEQLTATERAKLVTSVSPGRLRNVFIDLFCVDVEPGQGMEEVLISDRKMHSRAWGAHAADVVNECPWILPGCSSFMCLNLAGCCEAALPTLLCTGCRRARFCSPACQRESWVNGHREVCEKFQKGEYTRN